MTMKIPTIKRHPSIMDLEVRANLLGQKCFQLGGLITDNPYAGLPINLQVKWDEGFSILAKAQSLMSYYSKVQEAV